jgi:hypothetical protein
MSKNINFETLIILILSYTGVRCGIYMGVRCGIYMGVRCGICMGVRCGIYMGVRCGISLRKARSLAVSTVYI